MGQRQGWVCVAVELAKRDIKMKIVKIILVIIIIALLSFGAYKGYNYFKQWEANRFSEMAMLKANQDMFLQKITDLSVTITRVVNDTQKTTTTPKPDNTYVELKEQVIELKHDETRNKAEIEKLREELSAQRQAFLASDDTILIKKDGENILLYRDTEGNLQPASEGIEKIIEHKDVSDVPILPEEEIANNKTMDLKAGGYYAFDQSYGVIISKPILHIKDYSLNISLLINDFENFRFIAGGDIGWEIRDNVELAVGYNTDKVFYGALRLSF